ncbi:MAG: ribosome maturation factor RimM [Breznakia sp.]
MEKVKIGVLFNTHGLRGEMKVSSFSDNIKKRLSIAHHVMILHEGNYIDVEIKTARFHKGIMLISFVGMQDINLVEKYKGCTLHIFPNDTDAHIYYYQLMGCKVYDQNDSLLGVVEDVLETGANPVLRVRKDILIPFVDAFIIEVKVKQKYLKMKIIEGML